TGALREGRELRRSAGVRDERSWTCPRRLRYLESLIRDQPLAIRTGREAELDVDLDRLPDRLELPLVGGIERGLVEHRDAANHVRCAHLAIGADGDRHFDRARDL